MCVPIAAVAGTSTRSSTRRWLCAGMCSSFLLSVDQGAADCASEPAGLNVTAEAADTV